MKIGKKRDLIICMLLIGSLALAAFLVSCSEDGSIFGPNSNGLGTVNSTEDTQYSAIVTMFTNIAEGAEAQVGSDITGWVLGAMGIAGSSGPNYSQQIANISEQLDSIITLLVDVDNELAQINQTLLANNCGYQSSTLQDAIGEIEELYNQYNAMLSVASVGDTIPDTTMRSWADKVLGNNPGWTDIGSQMSHMQENLESNSGAIYSCVKALRLPEENMLNGDTSYYNGVDAITNYYYYWQAIGLLLINEADHYYAWVEAGEPGGNILSADSIQSVCDTVTANGSSLLNCDHAAIETNKLYNSLLSQMTYGGAQYTSEHFVFQYSSTNPVVWTRSLEDFTVQAGYNNCRMPLYNGDPCGPTAGYFYTKLTDTTYRGLSGLTFANSTDLIQWIDVTAASSYSSIYEYLDAQGFNSMISKTVIASDSIVITFFDANETSTVVPFFTSNESVQNMYDHPTAVVQDGTTFSWVFYPKQQSSNLCGYHEEYTSTPYKYFTNSGYQSHDSWTNGTGYVEKCSDGSYVSNFHFDTYPGFSAVAQRNGSVAKRYLWPVVHALNAKCTNGRSNIGPGGMPTMCSDNFTSFLNANVPRPPTCSITRLNTPCVTLN